MVHSRIQIEEFIRLRCEPVYREWLLLPLAERRRELG